MGLPSADDRRARVKYRRCCNECWHCAGTCCCFEEAEHEACHLRHHGFEVIVVRI
jgi:hypothetical protein